MKISYVLQLKDFSIMLGIGFILGICYTILNTITLIKQNIIIQFILDIIFSIIAVSAYIILINIINMGEFRLFLLIGYLIGFALERITFGKLFAKCFKRMYNWLLNKITKFAKSKLGRIIFK